MNSRFFGALAATLALAVAGAAPAFGGAIAAGPMTGGNLLTHSNTSDGGGTNTVIGAAPVTGDGVLDTVVFGWSSSASCAAVRIKVFRPDGDNLDFIGERGPIAVTWNVPGPGNLTSAALAPPIAVQRGDWLGIAGVNAGSCGNPVGQTSGVNGSAEFAGDVDSSVAISSAAEVRSDTALALYASGNGQEEVFSGILAGIGSLAGAQGANFKTGLQATNPFFDTIIGRIVFHPLGQSAGPKDPSFNFSLDDVVAAMGLSGLWSADIYMSAGDRPPIIVARIFNDAGAGGTTGFTESLVDPTKVSGGQGVSVTGVLLTPPDLTKYRMNIGIRTIGGPVGVSVSVKDTNGNVIHTASSTYSANAFFQLSTHDFLGGFDIGPNQTLVITFSNGGAIIYGATTDNVTNDPSIQFLPYLFAIA
jgi:hypothetical protein